MTKQVVRVRRRILEECMKCPICTDLLQDATTICECLHTFCRKCIYGKLTEEDTDFCPVCNIRLGFLPVEKLRADHNLQEVRVNIFPSNSENVDAPESVPLIPMPIRTNEQSLSSKGVSSPQVTTQHRLTGRRTKAAARKAAALQRSNHKEAIRKEEGSLENSPDTSSSIETLSKISQNRRESLSTSETSNSHTPNRHPENSDGLQAGKEAIGGPICEAHNPEDEGMEHAEDSAQDHSNGTNMVSSGMVSPKKFTRMGQKRGASSKDRNISTQAVVDGNSIQRSRGICPIWFTLVASQDQERYGALPQITARYLKITDRYMPVSFIQKYLMVKLNLISETEVEIKCLGETIPPTLQIKDLLNWWLEKVSSSGRVHATVGKSAEQFVMELQYGRNVQQP